MIYILYEKSDPYEYAPISSVWEVEETDIRGKYTKYMVQMAYECLDLIINPSWLNAMAYNLHNQHLTEDVYSCAVRKWKNILSDNPIEVFIRDILKGKQLEFKEL